MTAHLSGRIAALLATLAVLLVVLVGWFVLISPEISKADDLQTQVDDTQAQLASTQAYVNDPKNKRNVLELKHLQTLLPDDLRMSQVLRQLSTASAAARIQIQSIAPTTAVPGGTAEANPITLSVQGHYTNISRFAELLNAKAKVTSKGTVAGDGRLYSITGINFTKGGSNTSGSSSSSKPDPNLLTASISLSVYTYSTAPATTTTPTTTGSSDLSTSG